MHTLPASAAWLGYGGLLPFISLPLLMIADHDHRVLWSDALTAYGAVILSFVGALHWAFAMLLPELDARQQRNHLIWSVIPALIAWPSALLSLFVTTPLLIAGFIAPYLQDLRLSTLATLPQWYLPLRLHLTVLACLSLTAAAVVTPLIH